MHALRDGKILILPQLGWGLYCTSHSKRLTVNTSPSSAPNVNGSFFAITTSENEPIYLHHQSLRPLLLIGVFEPIHDTIDEEPAIAAIGPPATTCSLPDTGAHPGLVPRPSRSLPFWWHNFTMACTRRSICFETHASERLSRITFGTSPKKTVIIVSVLFVKSSTAPSAAI